MKVTLALVGFLAAATGGAMAATVVASAANDIAFADSSGNNLLTTGATVDVGWFDTGSLDGTDLVQVTGNFVSVAQYTFPYGGLVTYNGFFGGGGIAYDDTDGVAGDNVFLFVQSGGQWALLENTAVTFKADADIPNTTNVSVESGTLGQFTIHTGTWDAGNDPGAALAVVGTVNLVPEPSAMLLGAFGMIGLLRRRRG